MTIAPITLPAEITPRDNVSLDVQMIIDGAASSPDDIDSFTLARQIMEAIEPRINSVDHEGNVIYRD